MSASVISTNVQCGTSGVTCSKQVLVNYGKPGTPNYVIIRIDPGAEPTLNGVDVPTGQQQRFPGGLIIVNALFVFIVFDDGIYVLSNRGNAQLRATG